MKKIKLAVIICISAVVGFISFSFVEDYFDVTKNLDIYTSLFKEVNNYYVDSINPSKLMKKGIDEMLSSLDPYTNYIPETEMQDYRFMTTGQYGGIGALIKQKGDYVAISDPYQGFPADRAGIQAGDIILEIDSISAKNKKTDEISHILKGTPNTKVRLLIQRDGEKKPIEKILTREEIKVKSVPYYGMITNDIGYIRLNSFTDNCSKEISDAIKSLKEKNKLKGLIFDLRGNPGGLLNEAVNVSNLFVDKGTEIVSTRGKIRDYDKSYKGINEAADLNIPVAVLVSSGSASASEIVSGSLQDLDRAVIIGQRTYGKGLVQTTRALPYNSQVKITTAKYYIPSGRCIQALDYSHRNEDGSVGKIPDSLMHAFKTHAGRTVFDGGGILPDVVTEPKKASNIAISLLNKNLIFDFATHYHQTHPLITADNFRLTDSDFNDFKNFISDKDYDYVTKSEKSLEDLKKNSEDEKYFSSIQIQIDSLKTKLAHDKVADVDKNKDEIVAFLQDEIASRYFYQAGRIRSSLKHDDDLNKAVDVLKDGNYYTSILNGSAKADAGQLPLK